jgi:hypothetical protein
MDVSTAQVDSDFDLDIRISPLGVPVSATDTEDCTSDNCGDPETETDSAGVTC